MSELSTVDDSQSFISTRYPEATVKLIIDHDEGLTSSKKIYSDSTENSLPENLPNFIENNKTFNNLMLPVKNRIQHEYPLTEMSKRKIAAKIRTECSRENEQIKKINEAITRGAEVIKYHSKRSRVKKFESLKKINNYQWHCNRSYSHDSDLQNQSVNEKIETLELNLKRLENELMVENNKFANENKSLSIVSDLNRIEQSDESIADTNSGTSHKIIDKYLSTTTEHPDESKPMDIFCSPNSHVHKMISSQETRLTFSPKYIEFRVSNAIRIVSKQQIKISNRSKDNILCRYSHLFDPNSVLRDDMNIIKVKSVALCRLLPGVTVDYAVIFEPKELSNYQTYLELEGVELVFETASNNRPDVKYVFHVPVKFCSVKPEPELVTETITFSVSRYSSNNVDPKDYLILKNNGDAECVFSVVKETEYLRKPFVNDGFANTNALNSTGTVQNSENIFQNIISSIVHKIFDYFIWKNHLNVPLPAKGCVKVPVRFNQSLARSTVAERYVIVFHNTEHIVPNQIINVIGHVKDGIIVEPDVIDAGLCYLTGSVQVVGFRLHNNSRTMVPFEIKLPPALSGCVRLSLSKGYLKAESSIEILVRIRLKYNILQRETFEAYFDADTGFLDFPVRVHPSNSGKYHEVRVLMVVTTAFGLTLTPDALDFGTVNTAETVVRSVLLTNRSKTALTYGFLELPERVSVHPSGFGTIFSGERLLLHVHYSPGARDLPRNVHTFEDDFVLTCYTVTGLNADRFDSELTLPAAHNYETITEKISISINNQASSVYPIDELDHGSDKIQIVRSINAIETNSLDKNVILKEATTKCHARVIDIPAELSVQKVIFGKTHFTSYSTFKIELRASNLASLIERNITSFPDFKIKFEFVSNDTSVEFKPKNGILRSKEIIQIYIILRPKFDDELQNMYEECLNSEILQFRTKQIVNDESSYINQVYRNKPFLHEQVKIFETNNLFYSSTMVDRTNIISAVCFIQLINTKSKEYFGFDTGSLKLCLVYPVTKPNIILLSDRINFGKCTMDVRHNEWLLVRNITTHSVPLKMSLPNPIGPFFCAFALNGEKSLLPGQVLPINVSFLPEHEETVNEVLEVTSESTRLPIRLCGSGLGPSCKITPDEIFNIIRITHGHWNNKIIFRVTNTSGTGVRFNVQMDWTKERLEPMTDAEADDFVETLRANRSATALMTLDDEDGPDWTVLENGGGVFDLGNNGRPLWFRLDPDGARYVQVTFRPPRSTFGDDGDGPEGTGPGPSDDAGPDFWRRVYAAKFNVHVGRTVLRRFYVFGFDDGKTVF